MTIHAVVFDIYNTLLKVGPPPSDADARWQVLFRDFFGSDPVMTRLEFSIACNHLVARMHEAARGTGIAWPEIQWPSVVAEVVTSLARLGPDARAEFVYRQIQTGHTTSLSSDVARTLRTLRQAGCLLGIASNAQAYSQRELNEGLAGHGLSLELFEPSLCFWSFEHGFSKPDPHVFRLLTARLEARGIAPQEILMVGDRPDNDLEPARAHGWGTVQIGVTAPPNPQAEWDTLLGKLVPLQRRSLG